MKFLILAALAFAAVRASDFNLMQTFSAGQTRFSANVYKELLKSHSGNFVVCPMSVDIVLALIREGAKANTADQISKSLFLPEVTEAREIFKELKSLLKGNEHYSLSSANKVYLKESFVISQQFKKNAVEIFDAEIETIDFGKTAEAVNEINKWVEGKTHDKIKNLLTSKDIDNNVLSVLVNALYFQAKWATPFDHAHTEKKHFHLNNKDQVEVDMMQKTAGFNYYENPEMKAKFLELPYEETDITMTIVLPDEVEGLSTLEGQINNVLAPVEYKKEKVHITLPKFKAEAKIELKPILVALGITDLFQDNADLSGIGAQQERLKIAKVIQKAFIEVDEEGTTAAAATAALAVLGSAPGIPKEFLADHPFIYYLRSPAGILFVGRYVNSQ